MSDQTLERMGHHPAKHTAAESATVDEFSSAFERSTLPLAQRLQNFPRHVRRQDLARFLTKYELFKQVVSVNGSVVECGVFAGGGLATWAHCSAILEPYNHTRRVIGFDTFSGFPEVHAKDSATGTSTHLHAGALNVSERNQQEIASLMALHDRNRPLGHIAKVELVAGDATQTIPSYVEKNPHLLVSLLYLDFDIYAPTRAALEAFLPRLVRGGIVAFDELNCAEFPGETQAFLESGALGLGSLRRMSMDPHISYLVRE